jgi:5-methylcytosine-specific restriction endonuclease McrA
MSESITFTVPKTKTALKKMLVEERKTMRTKQKNSSFMRRTRNIYSGLCKRDGHTVDFTVDDMREWALAALEAGCSYCATRLTVAKLALDHVVPICRGGKSDWTNLCFCCQSCNWQKGSLTADEFLELLALLKTNYPPEAAADVKRRLTIGGKWSFKS